ncbi:hypothetical protein GCM10009827_002430 [Dactylosporangium maewongense]|uniref:Uncharacterized protein n=1 Tax=Dactylosporangium maewongense TaxID=634393 RepID=A0ABN1ZIA0_9ACTN
MEDYDEDAPRQVVDDSNYQRPLTLTEPPGTVTWCDSHDGRGSRPFRDRRTRRRRCCLGYRSGRPAR